MRLTCICCDFTQEFANEEAAFQAGWDAPPHFSLGPLCHLCPAAPVALLGLERASARHAPLHRKWAVEGRPAEFDRADEYDLDGLTPAEVEDHEQQIAKLQALVADYRKRTTH